MKRAIVCILVFVLVFSINPFVYAEESSGYDFSGWTDDQMLYLFSQVEAELDRRELMKPEESSTELSSESTEVISVTASELEKAFRDNEISANKTYKSKTIEVSGTVFDLMSFGYTYVVYLDRVAVTCYFDFDEKNEDDLADLKKGDSVTIRGTYKQYRFGEISVDNCEVVHQE